MIWWEFRCDQNHQWTAYAPDSAEPTENQVTCPIDGTVAVTAARQPSANRVSVVIIPAARIVDVVKNSVGHESEYLLKIQSADATQFMQSSKTFAWDEAVAKAGLFRNTTWEQATNRWQRTGLGS